MAAETAILQAGSNKGEARISVLKRRFGMTRTPNRGAGGMARTAIWAGIANNLAVMAR
jgi:hypothetical protein